MIIPFPAHIHQLTKRGAVFFVSDSGGKDSQLMKFYICNHVPHDQVVVIHAHLPGAEWPGVKEHIEATTPDGIEVLYCEAVKTFEQMVLHRRMFPSPKHRQCTSDLKRGPIKKAIRHWLKRHGHSGLVVECMGFRAEESPGRKKSCADPFKFDKTNSKAGREWYTWLPIADATVREVFAGIAAAGQDPHWAYGQGMSRLSCCFCIMANPKDQATAARLQPDLYARYVATERLLDHTISMNCKPLPEVTGVAPDEGAVRRHLKVLQDKLPKAVA